MSKVKLYVVLFLLFLLERVFFARVEIFGLTPWVVYTFLLVYAALCADFFFVAAVSVAVGAICDLTGGGAVGSAITVFAFSAAAMNLLTHRVLNNGYIITVLLTIPVSIAGELFYFYLNRGGVLHFSLGSIFGNIVLLLTLLNTVFAILLYPLAKKISKGGSVI
ncbi:MAG: hypothetical protein Q4B31_00165 [Clostridia bacterium]|nr:hypothetical protein [Clostridia bacterium]